MMAVVGRTVCIILFLGSCQLILESNALSHAPLGKRHLFIGGVDRKRMSFAGTRLLKTKFEASRRQDDFSGIEDADDADDSVPRSTTSSSGSTAPPEIPVSMGSGLGEYDPAEKLRRETINVGDPQIKVKEKGRSVTSILKELAAIQQQGPQKYCILGTRHCSYLHQQIIELL